MTEICTHENHEPMNGNLVAARRSASLQEMNSMEINGKEYPMWGQFVDQKKEWVGGTLRDIGDSMDRGCGFAPGETEIVDITLTPNGTDSAYFEISGKDFACGLDVRHGGLSGSENLGGGYLSFSGYGGHIWGIKKP